MHAALQVAQQELAAGNVIREVAQGLHGITPRVPRVGHPARVAVELLEVEDEGLDEGLAPVAPVLPDLGAAHEDVAVDDVCRVPVVDDALGPVDDVELLLEVVVLERGAGLELLGHARLPGPGARDVSALPHILEGPSGEEAVSVDVGRRGVVVPGEGHGHSRWGCEMLLESIADAGVASVAITGLVKSDAIQL